MKNSGDFASKIIQISGTDGLQTKGYLEANIALPSTKEKIVSGTVTFDTNGTLSNVVLQINDNEKWTFDGDKVIAGKGEGVKGDPTP